MVVCLAVASWVQSACQGKFATNADSHLIPVIPQALDAMVVAMHVRVIFILGSPVHSADMTGEKGQEGGGEASCSFLCVSVEKTQTCKRMYIYMYSVCIYIYKGMGVYIYIFQCTYIYIYEPGI
jgi:hypothetical protein